MKPNYEENSKIIKAISDPKRLQIIDILSCGERCACDILEHFDFTQPTLSHHMKILQESSLVNIRKDGLWNYYSLNLVQCNKILLFLMNLITDTEDCICKSKPNCKC
ncbi:metalloregulator ArsR/SmtB family transcription factor [Proteiniborus sp. MB09-C3]|uniref:ArsR/SmtB family transcription factor n=1 Tax=Proteiniborus sp. MB09-C3 TaxID=3050072 RepID=UPI0025553954|nr:metalloregulator ArsR/SmtB family transcription factor [Proteiniborus sp. MB09-C3]WIV10457.1 metalloregulator ArsR/SmtB family transcription factor [Proteiniborus sp. MB09-C3]